MNAIIMAAGTSSRFAPLSYEKPKGLLQVKGEILIERQIRQLQEAGISDIIVVVGYMAELTTSTRMVILLAGGQKKMLPSLPKGQKC